MAKPTFSKPVKFLTIIIAFGMISWAGVMIFTSRSIIRDNPRSIPNSYLMTYTTKIERSPEQVFNFIKYNYRDHNLSIAKAHEKFEIINSDNITQGAVIEVEEYQENEGVKHKYIVHQVIPNRLIYMASTPTEIYQRSDGQLKQQGTCNSHVYFDLKENRGHTDLTQTIVIEMPNMAIKFLTDVIIAFSEKNEWLEHLIEEVDGLKIAIEESVQIDQV